MTKVYVVTGASGRWELDDVWIVASFSTRQEAEAWKKWCEEYWKWIDKMHQEAGAEEVEKGIYREARSGHSPKSLLMPQWLWAVVGTEEDQLREASEKFGRLFSDWEDYQKFWENLPVEQRKSDLESHLLQEIGWMLSPYDPHLGHLWDWAREIRYEVKEVDHNPLPPLGTSSDNAALLTLHALRDPQPGDRFNEFLSYWIYVVYREGNEVWYCEANPPCEFPQDAKLTKTTVEKMFNRFTYTHREKAWVRLSDRGNDVTGWIDAKYREVVDER
jgi:hypothetical protein